MIGEFDIWAPPVRYPKDLNVGLSAAAYTGWLSLQGPGPFRSASSWYTLSAPGSESGGDVEAKITVQLFPDELPTVRFSSFESYE